VKEQKKKRFIAALLLISCLISGYMLFSATATMNKGIQTIAQVDSLVQQELTDFNITKNQISVSTTRVDSTFNRKTYYIRLPYQFSKTQFHAELNDRFFDYGIETPAQVHFPGKDVDIHLLFEGTVIRTLSLQTDPELTLNRNGVSILVTFDDQPDVDLIEQLSSLGEPIPVVIKIENPLQANDLRKKLNRYYDHILFWLQDRHDQDLIKSNPKAALTKLEQFENILPQAKLLHFGQATTSRTAIISKTDLTFINGRNALFLDQEMGKNTFVEKLHTLQSNRNHSLAVITGNEEAINWLKQELPELKKAGFDIVPPTPTSY